MKITIIILSAFTGLFFFSSWNAKEEKQAARAEWLLGTWKSDKAGMYETWTKKNDDEFLGKSYVLKKNDTIVFETIRLVSEHDSLFYIPSVRNQNEGLPVRFAATLVSPDKLVFENPSHDFPQIISYTKTGEDALTAEISGKNKSGKERKQTFPMTRVN